MTTALQEPPVLSHGSPADHLRQFAAAMRLSFTWFGVRKSLTPQQKEQAAESFGAAGDFLSAGKKLIDTKHPAFKAVTQFLATTVGGEHPIGLGRRQCLILRANRARLPAE